MASNFYPTYVENLLVKENSFLTMPAQQESLPTFAASRAALPEPFWEGHPAQVACYWKAWELAFKWLRQPTRDNGFKSNYIDTAFNGCLFLWDSVFILMFGRYGSRVFDFQRTLDNLYAKQHPDGFICRQIDEKDGRDYFSRFDPSATGPNVFAWSEWEYWRHFADKKRLERVFPVILAYHQWLSHWHSWPDGSLWSTGWGCGMDNQPRVEGDPRWDSGHMAWSDATLQQCLSARLLAAMAGALGRAEGAGLTQEAERLETYCNTRLWDPATRYYYDRRADGSLNQVKSIAAYWALLAEVAGPSQVQGLVAHLEDDREFNRPHRVPSLSADHPAYRADGGYWLGGVWPSTNYMVLRGLTRHGQDSLAHQIGLNHHANVTAVFEKTGTLFENYRPEGAGPGTPSLPDMVGWGGLGPIAVFFEYVIGLRPETDKNRLVWDVRLLEAHGIKRYPFGPAGLLDLSCASRASQEEKPRVTAHSNLPVELLLKWEGGEEKVRIG